MKLSKTAFKNIRLTNLDKQYPVQDMLMQTCQLVQYGSGVFGFDTIPFAVQRNIEQIIREELNKVECYEINLPMLQQKEIWTQSGRWDDYIKSGTMFNLKTPSGEYCLAPTAEEAVMKFVENRISSYKALPVTFYQFGTKFRNEIRNRGYLNRGRSFQMKDAYSFDNDTSSMERTYNNIRQAYFRIFERLGFIAVAVAADNGAIGGSRSEEFMILSLNGEDVILFDQTTGQAFNKEILDRKDAKEYLNTFGINDLSKLQEQRATELGHIFQLGTSYSEKMNIKFTSSDNKLQPYHMGCYGIGISRTLGLIYENNAIIENGNAIGVSLPESVAPYKIQIVSKSDNKERSQEAESLYKELLSKNLPAILDDTDSPIGVKIRNCKVLGTPLIAIFGDKLPVGQVEIENTRTSEKQILTTKDLIKLLSK